MLIPQLALNLGRSNDVWVQAVWLLRPQRRHGEKFWVIDETIVMGPGISPEQAQARALSLWMTITQNTR